MSSRVEAVVKLSSSNCKLVESIKKALEPDNVKTPRNMSINEYIKVENLECIYTIEVKIVDDVTNALKRARSTIEEILSIVKLLSKTPVD